MAFIPRIYLGSDSVSEGKAYVTGSDATHILRVLRKTVGDAVCICDMHGGCFDAIIEQEDGCSFVAVLGDERREDCEMPCRASVYQCFPKSDKPETVVQKAVELGAYEIVFVMSERCVSRPEKEAFEKRLQRLARISESAAAQCGRSFIPAVRGLIGFADALAEIKNADAGFVCYEGKNTVPVKELLHGEPKSIAFLIGPEGGLSHDETEKAALLGIPLAGLGKRILRTETASGYVLAAISVFFE